MKRIKKGWKKAGKIKKKEGGKKGTKILNGEGKKRNKERETGRRFYTLYSSTLFATKLTSRPSKKLIC
jgi:hypothetical protein